MPGKHFKTTGSRMQRNSGFTVIELILIIVIIAVLVLVALVSYNGTQHSAANSVVRQTMADAQKSLQTYYVFNKEYPANIADAEYAPPLTVAVSLYTDAPLIPVYSNLSPDQNAQLFLNSCNGFMPVEEGGTTYNTACVYDGNNLHVKGQNSSNVVINGPTVQQSDLSLSCGSECNDTLADIISTFQAQGGSFPLTVPKKGSELPAPSMETAGSATMYCLQAVSGKYIDIMYYQLPTMALPVAGTCPTNLGLHYP